MSVRALLERPVADVQLAELTAALAASGDENDRWEAKGGSVRSEHVVRAVAGLANREGGLLVLGASHAANGRWTLDGSTFANEPGTWLARVLRDNLRPAPPHEIATLEVSPGRFAALVRVWPHPTHPIVTADGHVFRREHGSTEPLADGAELTALVRARNATSRAAPLDPAAAPDHLADAALLVIEQGADARLRSFLAGLGQRLPRAAQFAPADELDAEADRLSAIAACLAQAAPDSSVTSFAVDLHHRVFDEAATIRPLPGGRPDLDLQRVLLRNARALGALLVRLELWPLVRALIDHDAPDPRIYPGWLTYIGVQQARALGRPSNAETFRDPVREAVATAQRVAALRPDGADEHQLLDSVLVFDLLANLIELDRSDRADGPSEVSPDFATFGATPHRSLALRVVNDSTVRHALLPERTGLDAIRLLGSLDAQARRLANAFGGFWDGIGDHRLPLP